MNKQEFIERIKSLKNIFGNKCEYVEIDAVIELASELDEPQKVTVPQFVADWIEYCKEQNFTLFGCLDPANGFESLAGETFEGDVRKCIRWCRKESNKFAHAWLDGYEVEKEKRYLVKMKGVNDYGCYLNKGLLSKKYFLESKAEICGCRTKHTRKQLEDDDFGWVFDCPGIEIEEVEE
ncbi:DUF1642 domain-containing protein [Streptococcus parasanguinis]|uniref:DUF1642 domain-containing protein n=1 Tax=Streptococcus parasanguinis TaxID=1318 RepID=UPI002000B2B3|nr:DUF1642 domain-containing protein [Streptococcus parasanguinis]